MQDRGGEFGVEVFEIAHELGKTQVYQAMKLIEASDSLSNWRSLSERGYSPKQRQWKFAKPPQR
jgi:hypothetical protein